MDLYCQAEFLDNTNFVIGDSFIHGKKAKKN